VTIYGSSDKRLLSAVCDSDDPVARPEALSVCWSRRRIYDRPFLDCLTEIDSAIGRLKGRGAGTIVSAGSSL
jgi:hypothetical protein